MSYLTYYYVGYKYLFEELANPITINWFMVGKPLNIIIVIGLYLFVSLKLGPWYMKHRKPYNLKNVITVYNLLQIIVNIYLFYEATNYVFLNEFNFHCHGVDEPNSPNALRAAKGVWYYYIVKIVDVMDTLFFVLRKSDRQITSLHLHHHSVMILASWTYVTYFPGGQGIIVGYFNSFVHAIMYTYYLIAGLGEEYKKNLWWKKYLTILQLLQFTVVGIHSTHSLFYKCAFPEILKIIIILYALVFINMFGNFYYKAYVIQDNKNCVINRNEKDVKNKAY